MKGNPPRIMISLILLSMALYLFLLAMIHFPVTTILKPIPIILLILYSIEAQIKGRIRYLLFLALGFSAIGDIVLTLPIAFAIQAGIIAFLVTHFFYICICINCMQFKGKRLAVFFPVLISICVAFYYLWPNMGAMQIPVMIYMSVLTIMVFFSFQVKQHALIIVAGAVLFLLSDFTISLDLFVLPNMKSIEILIMLLYYAAQFLLVMGISRIEQGDSIS